MIRSSWIYTYLSSYRGWKPAIIADQAVDPQKLLKLVIFAVEQDVWVSVLLK